MATGIGIDFGNVLEITADTVGVIKKDARLVAEAMSRMLNTSPYERPREPFGCRIKELVFEPNDFITATLGAYYVSDAVTTFEPRVEILQIVSTANRGSNNLGVRIVFRLKDNPQQAFGITVPVTG